jgi:PadR family transcriptional regulator PadR
MSSKDKKPQKVLQGTLDLIVLRNLATIGPQHAYQIATRLQQISEGLLNLNQGTLYPALVRLEQYGWIKGSWSETEWSGGEVLCHHTRRAESIARRDGALETDVPVD